MTPRPEDARITSRYRWAWAQHRMSFVLLAVIVPVGIACAILGAVRESPVPAVGMDLLLVAELGIVARLCVIMRRPDGG